MAAVALPNITVKWVKPAPLWDQSNANMTRPVVAEFKSDQFMPQFLSMMAGNTPIALNPPEDKVQQVDPLTKKTVTTDIFKLYLPLHQRYYLVTGSLVCRHLGLPDHTVDRKNKEKVSFVLRQMLQINGQGPLIEHGWVDKGPGKGWHPILNSKGDFDSLALLPDEERLPMHPVKVQPQPIASVSPSFKDLRAITVKPKDQRTAYHGYIPVAKREKYLAPVTNAAQLIQDEIMKPAGQGQTPTDPRLDEVGTRVIGAWFQLFVGFLDPDLNKHPPSKFDAQPDPTRPTVEDLSLFIIVDLGDFLQNNMPEVFKALIAGPSANLPTDGTYTSRQALLTELGGITVTFYQNGVAGLRHTITLDTAIANLRNFLNLAHGQGDEPADLYNLSPGNTSINNPTYLAPPPPYPATPPFPAPAVPGRLFNLFKDALAEDRSHKTTWLKVPPEFTDLIKNDPETGAAYFLRLVYEHDPCVPVLSDPSVPFAFAKCFDPDAPARPIRIELPSIKPKDLRKYKRGVGLQFSPELNNLIGRVNAEMLQKGPLSPMPADAAGSLGVAFICTFSISITFLVALIVMFIFLILFNIIFWWLPFIRICFPIPTRK
ncbi:MAG: hypothetical protein ACJ8DI_17380 [Ktedonobacteraceae bacterium]